jgi:hypothetical protein
MGSLLLQRFDPTGLLAVRCLLPARGELAGVLADPLGDEARGPAGERAFDHLTGGDRDLGLVLAVAGVVARNRKAV